MGGRFPGLRCSAISFAVGLAPSGQGPTVHSCSSAPPGPAPPATARHASLTVWSRTNAVTARSARPPCSTWDGTSPSTARLGLCCASASRSCCRASRHSASNPWRRSARPRHAGSPHGCCSARVRRQPGRIGRRSMSPLCVTAMGAVSASSMPPLRLSTCWAFLDCSMSWASIGASAVVPLRTLSHAWRIRARNGRPTGGCGPRAPQASCSALTSAVSATWRSTGRRVCFCPTRNGLKSMSLARRRPSLTWRRRSHSMI